MSLRHRSRMAHKAIPQRHHSDVTVTRCNNATPKQLIRFWSDVEAMSQSLDVNGPLADFEKIAISLNLAILILCKLNRQQEPSDVFEAFIQDTCPCIEDLFF